MILLYTRRFTFAMLFLVSMLISPECKGQCFAGTIVPDTIFVPLGETFDVLTSDVVVPDGYMLAWKFDSESTDGTGGHTGNGALYILGMQPEMATFNNDLNGQLSALFGPPLEGKWKVRAQVVDIDFNLCDESEEFYIIDFEKFLCFAGNLQTTGELTVCDGETFDLAVTDKFKHPYGYAAWYFNKDNTDGTGGFLDGNFVRSTGEDFNTYGTDLEGKLDGTENRPPVGGTWVVKAVIVSYDYLEFQGEGSFCSISEDSLIITFNSEIEVDLDNPNNTEVTALALGGTEPYTYTWSNGETGMTASNLSNGTLTVTVEDALGCTMESSIELDGITSTHQIENIESLFLFPNPATNELYVEVYFKNYSSFTIEVLDLFGKKHLDLKVAETLGGKYDVNIQNLPNGTYLLNIRSEKGVSPVRFVKF